MKSHFNLKVWVCVSDDFDVIRVTKTILQSLVSCMSDVNDLNQLQAKLKEELLGKKFLLVLDDVWNENCDKLDVLYTPMRTRAQSSRVIVTTRNEGAVSTIEASSAYVLQELSNDDCLSLFTQQALGTRNFDTHPHLKEVGEKIVKTCKGLPLAARTLGGMLRTKLDHDACMGSNIKKLDMVLTKREKQYSSSSQIELSPSSFSFEALFCILCYIFKRL